MFILKKRYVLKVTTLYELADQLPARGPVEYLVRLRTHGYTWNRKRIYRVYKTMRLKKRRKLKIRIPTRIFES